MELEWNNSVKKEHIIKIEELFPEAIPTTQGFKLECPDCGLQGGRTEGFILFPDSNSAYCHSSGKWFKLLEAYALKKKIIKCLDGRDKGDTQRKILGGELYTLTLDEFKNEFGTEKYNKLIEELNIRVRIKLAGNNRLITNFADELGDIYKSRNVLFFRGESRNVVEIGRYKKITENGKEIIENGFMNVEGNRFISLAEMFIIPYTLISTKNGFEEITKSMNQVIANTVLASPNFQNKLPIISRIFDVQIPILYKGKLTFPKKGYDERFGSWLPFNAPQITPNLYTLEQAKTTINMIFEEFCFASPKDRTHAVAGFITPFLRGLFPKFSTRTPVFIYMANRERAGKDYCAGCTGVLYEGANIEEPAISNDEKGNSNANEEIRKKIMACMIQGKKRFHSANNKGLLNNTILEGITTAEEWSDRILGRSENIKFDNEMDYSLSGNIGIRLTPDLTNRSRIIHLELIDEDANARIFKNPNLHGWILNNRGAIISALYTLVDNWEKKGRPKGTVPFTSFPHWSDICGGIMECAGYDNPCNADKSQIVALDSETEEMKQLYESCYAKYPDKWIMKEQIKEVVETEEIMPHLDFSTISDKTKFGMRIDKFVNRIMSEIMLKVDSLEQKSLRRKYKFTKSTVNVKSKNLEKNPNLDEKSVDGEIVDKKNSHDDKMYTLATLDTFVSPLLKNDEIYIQHGARSQGVQGVQINSPKNPSILPIPLTFSDLSKMYNDAQKKESEPAPKIKTDRELQFYESHETTSILERCTKEQVFEWIRNNPNASFREMYEKLGNGCLKWADELENEGLVKETEEGWEKI
jgi:hypothetical protein